jgi:DNA-binding beta-propeller fold protein YncE
MKMIGAILCVSFATLAAWPCAAPLASRVPEAREETTPAPLKLLQTIPIPGLKEGDFDHFAVDLAGHRLFLTAEKNSAVEVFDLNANKLIHTITGLDEPHSMLYRADLKKLFVVDGGAAEVRMYDTDSYKYLGGIKLKDDCDSNTYDPATKYLYVVNGGEGAHEPYTLISVIDTTAAKKEIADIKIETNSVEALALEKSGPRLFVNITGLNSVGVFDREKNAPLATWSIAQEAQHNGPLAFDSANHRLFLAATAKPEKFVVVDSDTGKVITSMPSVTLADEISYDAKNKRIYVAGDQFVYVFGQQDANHYTMLAKVPGSFRAKTALLVPELDRYYLAVPRHGNRQGTATPRGWRRRSSKRSHSQSRRYLRAAVRRKPKISDLMWPRWRRSLASLAK